MLSSLVIRLYFSNYKVKNMNTLKVGDKAPNFSALDENGNSIAMQDFIGKKLVVFFYPKANTPTCTTESCNLRDNYKLLKDKGFNVIGVSADSQKAQANFKKKRSEEHTSELQ